MYYYNASKIKANKKKKGDFIMAKMISYALRITEAEHELLNKKVEELGVTKASLIRLLIRNYLKEIK